MLCNVRGKSCDGRGTSTNIGPQNCPVENFEQWMARPFPQRLKSFASFFSISMRVVPFAAQLTQDDIDAGAVINDAQVQAEGPTGQTTNASDVHEETAMARRPGLRLGAI